MIYTTILLIRRTINQWQQYFSDINNTDDNPTDEETEAQDPINSYIHRDATTTLRDVFCGFCSKEKTLTGETNAEPTENLEIVDSDHS